MENSPGRPGLLRRARFAVARRFGSDSYTPFLILAHARTGSNFLLFSLCGHPAVVAHGEIFRAHGSKSILDATFARHPRFVQAVGFKLFYNHPTKGDPDDIWRQIRGIEGLHVIRLERRNLLRASVSRSIGQSTRTWMRTKREQSLEERRVSIDPDELVLRMEECRRWNDGSRDLFPGKPWLDLAYEELVAEPERELKKVQEFLGLATPIPVSTLERQNPEPLRDLIRNYDEVRARIAGTEWQWCLEE